MALGWSDAASQITIEPTLMGDTDLSGTVDNNDLGQLLKYFNQPGGWAQGDLDYNGTVDNNDLGALLANFNMSTALPLELSLGGVMAELAGRGDLLQHWHANRHGDVSGGQRRQPGCGLQWQRHIGIAAAEGTEWIAPARHVRDAVFDRWPGTSQASLNIGELLGSDDSDPAGNADLLRHGKTASADATVWPKRPYGFGA